jgi:hypothetical protein
MMAYVSALAESAADSAFGRWCGVAGAIIDSTIPIVLVVVIVGGCAMMALGVF